MKKLHIIVLVATMLWLGCKQEDTSIDPIAPNLKALFNWQPGSYWIMQDSATLIRDSFFVTSYKLKTRQGSYRKNEELHIELTELGLTHPSEPILWSVECGQVGDPQIAHIGRYYISHIDTTLYSIPFFETMPDSTGPVNINSKEYSHYYFNGIYFNINNTRAALYITLNKPSGLIYLRDSLLSRLRTWMLESEHIISTP